MLDTSQLKQQKSACNYEIVIENVSIKFFSSRTSAEITCSNLKRASMAGVTTVAAPPEIPFTFATWEAALEENAAAAAAALASECRATGLLLKFHVVLRMLVFTGSIRARRSAAVHGCKRHRQRWLHKNKQTPASRNRN